MLAALASLLVAKLVWFVTTINDSFQRIRKRQKRKSNAENESNARSWSLDFNKYSDWRNEKTCELGPRKLLTFVKKKGPVKLV